MNARLTKDNYNQVNGCPACVVLGDARVVPGIFNPAFAQDKETVTKVIRK